MSKTQSTKVVILSAGEGTRLKPLTFYVPKALCPIANCTLLRSILLQLNLQGFSSATVALPRSAAGMLDKVQAQAPAGFELTPHFAQKPSRGTVDTLRQIVGTDSRSTLVIYGDSLVSADFRKLVEAHIGFREKGGLATILYHRPVDLSDPDKTGRTYHGVMSVEPGGQVTKFVEKPKVSEIQPGFDLANAAVFVIERQLLDDQAFCNASDFSYHVFEPLAKSGNYLYGWDIGSGFRFDVGDISRFYDLNMKSVRKEFLLPMADQQIHLQASPGSSGAVAGAKFCSPVLVGSDVVIGDGAFVGPDVVIGDGCVVGSGAVVTRSVLMDNCQIGEGCSIDRCIIGPTTKIPSNSRLVLLVRPAVLEETIDLVEPS